MKSFAGHFPWAVIFLFLTCCSTRYVVTELDTSYHAEPASEQIGNIIVTIPKDSRTNTMNVPNFDRTWGYLTDRGMYNDVLSSQNIIAADIADIIANVCRAKGYNTSVVQDSGTPAEGTKRIIESEITEFWVDSSSTTLGWLVVTSLNLRIKVLDSNSLSVLDEFAVEFNHTTRKMAFSMSQAVKKTTGVYSENVEEFKHTLFEKLTLETM